nr:uncharacterized protein LOC112428994 [Macaca nemestrina]
MGNIARPHLKKTTTKKGSYAFTTDLFRFENTHLICGVLAVKNQELDSSAGYLPSVLSKITSIPAGSVGICTAKHFLLGLQSKEYKWHSHRGGGCRDKGAIY